MKLSIIVPVFNEEATIDKIINKVKKVNLEDIDSKELIVIDDGSTDGTKQILKGYSDNMDMKIHFQDHNMGKGATCSKKGNRYVIWRSMYYSRC